MDTNLFQKLKELGKVSSLRKFQLFAVNHKEMAAIKNCKTARWKNVNELIYYLSIWDLSKRICPKVVRRLLILTYLQTLQNNGYCFYKNVNHKNMHDIVHIQVYHDAANHSRSTNLILTGLSGTANNFWYISNGSW